MKKNLAFIGSIIMLITLIAGCASEPAAAVPEPEKRRDLPSWFMVPPVAEDVIYGLGMAKLSSDSLSRDTAIARARRDIATQVNTRVQTVMTDYAQEAGVDGGSQLISLVESITKQISDVELKGAVTEEVYPAMDGTWYAMVSYPKAGMTEEIADIFVRNEDAAFAEFKADQALKMLEDSLDKDPVKSSANAN